jgi:hypothetical protein
MRTIIIVILILLLQDVTYGGWVITEKRNNGLGNTSIQTTFIQNNVIRYETPTSIVIINLNTKLITMVFSEYRAYWMGTSYELKLNKISIYDMQLEKMLAGLPKKEQRELDSIYNTLKMQMLDSTNIVNTKNISILKTDEEQVIFGYTAQKYNIVDSILIESIWHTTELNPYDDINIGDMILMMQQVNQTPIKVSLAQSKGYLDLLEKGILLKSIEFLPNNNSVETTVTNIREIDIASDFFTPPGNYAKVSLFDILFVLPEQGFGEIKE